MSATARSIGFVGLGNMGGNMAARLLAAGYHVYGVQRSRDHAEQLIEQGLQWRDSPRSAERRSFRSRRSGKDLQIERADARTRTGDPFVTSVDQAPSPVAPSRARPHGYGKSPPPRWRPKTRDDKGLDPA